MVLPMPSADLVRRALKRTDQEIRDIHEGRIRFLHATRDASLRNAEMRRKKIEKVLAEVQ